MDSNITNSSKVTKPQRKIIEYQSRVIVSNVYDFLKEDCAEILKIVNNPLYQNRQVLISVLSDRLKATRRRTALAVGVSERTIDKIRSEKKKGDFMSPFKDRKIRPPKLELTKDNVNLIRSTINNYQSEHNESPTIKILFPILKEKLNYTGKMGAFRNSLSKLGYKWHMKNGKSELIDFSSVIKLKTDRKDGNFGEKSSAKKPIKKKTKLKEVHAEKTAEKNDQHVYIEIEPATSTQPTQNNFNLKREFVDPSYEQEIDHHSNVAVEFMPSAPNNTNDNQKYIMKTETEIEIVNENWEMHTNLFNR